MICEVPDLHLYPLDPAGLALYEHQNHFTVPSFVRLARTVGLRVVHVSHELCSRSFGFAAVLVASDPLSATAATDDELEHTVSCVAAGAALLERRDRQLAAARAAIAAACIAELGVVVWGANDTFISLSAGWRLPDGLVVIDSDPSKRDFLNERVVEVPDAAVAEIHDAQLLIICAPRHANSILRHAATLRDEPFTDDQVLILGDDR